MSVNSSPLATDVSKLENLTIKTARDRCDRAIAKGFRENDPFLLEALPSMGKSSGVIRWAAKTGNPLVVFTARHELYGQFREWCKENNLTYQTLGSFDRECETANGSHGSKWETRVANLNRAGLLPTEIHARAQQHFGEQLPCQQEGECPYFINRNYDTNDIDVLIGHYKHAYVPDRTKGRYVVFDEFPEDDFLNTFNAEMVSSMVGNYLSQHEELPFEYLKDLKEYRRDPKRRKEAIGWFAQNNPRLERNVCGVIANKNGSTHSEAAALTYAILTADDLDNRWEYSQLPDGRIVIQNPSNGTYTLFSSPDLSGAESVIALDGTPTVEKWQLVLGDRLQHQAVLTNSEKREYLHNVLELEIIQTSEYAQHYSGRSAIGITPERDVLVFKTLKNNENQCPALITSQSAMRSYEGVGLTDIIDTTEYYGNLKGSNSLSDVRLGIVSGSPHYGDDYILKWAALAGKSAKRVDETKGMEQDFGTFGNQILYGMRENEVLQAVMRFGRDGGGATVYVHTAALPDWVEPTKNIAEIHQWEGKEDGMWQVVTAIRDQESWSEGVWKTAELVEMVSISKTQLRNHLNTLAEHGYIRCDTSGRAYRWRNICLRTAERYGHVEFGSDPEAD